MDNAFETLIEGLYDTPTRRSDAAVAAIMARIETEEVRRRRVLGAVGVAGGIVAAAALALSNGPLMTAFGALHAVALGSLQDSFVLAVAAVALAGFGALTQRLLRDA